MSRERNSLSSATAIHHNVSILNGTYKLALHESMGAIYHTPPLSMGISYGVSGVERAHYQHPLTEHVYHIYLKYWKDVAMLPADRYISESPAPQFVKLNRTGQKLFNLSIYR